MIRVGKYESAKTQLQKMIKENKVDVPESLVDSMIEHSKAEEEKRLNSGSKTTSSLLDLCSHFNLLKKSLIIFFLWFVNSGTYYGLSLGASNLGGNPYINFLISAAVEIPAYALNLLLLNNPKVGRR